MSTTNTGSLGGAIYESEKAAAEYLLFHFGNPNDIFPYDFPAKGALNFAQRCGQFAVEQFKKHASVSDSDKIRAFDVGCAVGGSAFEMANTVDEVIGIDFSHSFINIANDLKIKDIAYHAQLEGSITRKYIAAVDKNIASKCTFEQGDAMNLRQGLGQFHIVLAANLICRLSEPRDFIQRLKDLVVDGGIVVLISPQSYLEDYTPKDKWLGGYTTPDGKEIRAANEIQKAVENVGFTRVYEKNMDFLIREHVRKFQYGVSHAVVYKKSN